MSVRNRLAGEIQEILKMPGVAAKLKDLGAEEKGTTPEQFAAFLKPEYKRWGDTIQAAGITVN